MKKLATVSVIWILCGLYSWGTVMAKAEGDGSCFARLHVGEAAVFALMGPFGAPLVALDTNFNEHGWTLWYGPPYPYNN